MADNAEIEREVMQLQNYERQLQAVMMQKQQIQMQLSEANLALEELKKAKGSVYKAIGSVMIKTTAADAEKDLAERKNLMEMRVKTLNSQEEKVKSELLRLQKKLKDELGQNE
ncbi:MAG: prefoldin subunit beta [Candidatus Micrarchaeia archaeon]|jgi:prefoldin beta subunit